MASDDLEMLDTKELYERAVGHAVRHLDVAFLWRLIESIPAAEAAAGDVPRAQADVMKLSALLTDLANLDEGPLAEALRPLYIEYLRGELAEPRRPPPSG